MKKKILAVFLSLCMAMSLLPIGAMAAESGSKDLNQENLSEMANQDASESATRYWKIPSGDYKLTSNIDLNAIQGVQYSMLFDKNTESTLDLNGYSITSSNMAAITNQGTLTIKDSSTGKTGRVTGSRGVDNYGALTLESGTIHGTSSYYATIQFCASASADTASFTMNGGTVTSLYTNAIGFTNNTIPASTSITLKGGTVGGILLKGNTTLTVGESSEPLNHSKIAVGAITTFPNNTHAHTLNLYSGIIEKLPSRSWSTPTVTYAATTALIVDNSVCPDGYHFDPVNFQEKTYYQLKENTVAVAKLCSKEGAEEEEYYSVLDAVDDLKDGYTLKLLTDYTITYSSQAINIKVPNVTLDLNGYNIISSAATSPVRCSGAASGTFTITNSSTTDTSSSIVSNSDTISDVSAGSDTSVTVVIGANVTVNAVRLNSGARMEDTEPNRALVAVDGSYDNLYAVTLDGTDYIYGGSDLSAIGIDAKEAGTEAVTATLLGNATNGISYGNSNNVALTVGLDGHVVTGTGNTAVGIPSGADGTSLTVQNGTVHGAISAAGASSQNCTLTLKGLTMTSNGDAGIGANGALSDGLKLTLTDCTLTSTNDNNMTTGIFFPVENGVLTIENSTITGYNTGVQAYAGSVTITGEDTVITGSGVSVPNIDKETGKPAATGPIFDGSAVSIIDRNTDYGALTSIQIKDGSFRTDVSNDAYGAVHVASEVEWKPGTFDKFNNTPSGGTQIVQVSGGTFTSSVKEYVTDELKAELYSAGSGTYTYYPNTEAAADNAKPGDAVSNITETTSHTIKVVYDNGTADQTIPVSDNATYILPAAPTRPGYTFQGWNDGTMTYQPGDKVAISDDTTFTAVWTYIPPANPNYKITIGDMENGTVTADPAAAKAGATVTLTATPDEGYALGTITVTDRFGDAVKVTENADGTYTFTMPNGQVTVKATFVETEEPAPAEPFPDVDENDWFYDEVVYVYENGLMNGVENNQFAPNTATNRAMLATILYRLAGEPAVSGDLPFTDVESGTWYTDAVLWAAQNGIVNGLGENTFAPMNTLTREQLVTMLYRYAEAEGYDVSAAADLSGYPDAGKVQTYAQEAMTWAVAEGIVEGMDGNLNPAGHATRAQIATILMRFCEGVAK